MTSEAEPTCGCDEASVGDVLSDLGVAPFPAPDTVTTGAAAVTGQLLPALDLTALVKPITDLLATFGTGTFGGAGNPATTHQSISSVLESGVSALLGAVRSIDGGWLGQAATSAATAATTTAAESGAVAAQGSGMAVDLQAAAGVVAAGAAELQGVVVKTAGLLAATAPTIMTPPGQIAALGIAAEGLAEGVAVVASTRAQLVAPTADMTRNGVKVPVTSVPGGSGDGFSTAASILTQIAPLVQAGAQLATSLLSGTGLGGDGAESPDAGAGATTQSTANGACQCPTTGATQTASQATGTQSSASTAAKTAGTVKPTMTPAGAGGGGVSGSGLGGGVAAPTVEPTPLADCPTTTNASTTEAPVESGGVQVTPAGATTGVPLAPMSPMTAGARPSETVRAPIAVSVEPVAETPAAEPDWLVAASSDALSLDVALALGIGHQELAGSA